MEFTVEVVCCIISVVNKVRFWISGTTSRITRTYFRCIALGIIFHKSSISSVSLACLLLSFI